MESEATSIFCGQHGNRSDAAMEWLWPLFEPYVRKQFERDGVHDPADADLHDAFVALIGEATVTILVQEPWRGSVRFKGLDRMPATSCFELLNEPETYLQERFGGGKFKLNFHEGWNFVATRNFKPDGEPRWKDMPEVHF